MISYLEKAINDMSASLSNASEAVAKNNSKLEMISWARSQRAQPTFPTLPLNASASKSILQSNESAKHNTTATNDSATESIMQRYNSTEQSRYKLRSHVDNISSALTLDIATPKNESESVSQSYNSTEQSWYEVGGHFDNMTSALTLGISAAKNATRAIRVLHAEKKELNIRGQQLATEAVLLLEKVSRLELELDVETLARTTCEATLSNTKANLTKTWTLLQEDSAELKLEKEGHAVELQRRKLLERELAAERTKFEEFDKILKKEQVRSALLQQQSRIMAFLAPTPHLKINSWSLASDATPRPGTSARDRPKVLRKTHVHKVDSSNKKSSLGRLTSAFAGLLSRKKVRPFKAPTSFFTLPAAELMGKDEIIAERAQLKTVEAIQIEIAMQRRELASKDSELEMETRQVEQARALAKELKRALDRQTDESFERYHELHTMHTLFATQKDAATSKLAKERDTERDKVAKLEHEIARLQSIVKSETHENDSYYAHDMGNENESERERESTSERE
eukprot:CAMPEP_0179449082 /NCGR_PEP_ID=MMETSP0799-20121207/33074_1 /TAXON_ID=46947 /ORGANISM="Geminigera cryophila, Strain CCMP2564" /LENGTH=512 /DNA_ID=CAMNT_0021241861 /DNA_START=128 /DNA_END=1663 /DNA_ORIENTATION=+